jgi:hypothetical protein
MPEAAAGPSPDCASLIPSPIVRLNRLTIMFGVIFGRRASLIYQLGTRVLRPAPSGPEGEDPRLMRFNNALAAVLLGSAQLAFLLHAPIAGWIFSALVALAAAVALAGFCFGCFLFYQFKLNRARIFGS